jgi:hypothetical protein
MEEGQNGQNENEAQIACLTELTCTKATLEKQYLNNLSKPTTKIISFLKTGQSCFPAVKSKLIYPGFLSFVPL